MTGAELRARREGLGLSQSALAARLGTTQNTVSRWELETLPIEKPEMLDLALRALEQEHGRTQTRKRRAQ
jgi:transcriptional regulator with XRE-family HTH domain